MPSTQPTVTRRALLGAVAALPLAGCADDRTPSVATTSAVPASPSAAATGGHHDRLAELERTFDARLGVYALATNTGDTIVHRADERFAFCFTFKGLAAAAVLHRHPLSHLDTVVRYTADDLMKSSVITRRHVASGMTIRQLCDAAVRHSDGTAGNLLLRDLGGPAQLTAYARSLGDAVTRMDRTEPAITTAIPGDARDTSSPRALGTTYQRIVLGDALPPEKRAVLRDLLERNATRAGTQRVRAGVPRGWTVADKTGTGDYGTVNDIAVVWPPTSAPLVIAIMSSKATRDAEYQQALVAEAAAYVAATLTQGRTS
ncbi:beta-lactamase class A [Micromonospora sp. M71_S20]|uniref:class A beta-lactamase n=1 Tax=Micromonospora sp. M71_S20 TaxID=592872 RepID=UPI000EACCEF1|nr:class A beta-lactamase [Micromonospora sp. M71_S20]RLK25886.1 beta-lactamase class A [Micromonospora sp. M71_S20]